MTPPLFSIILLNWNQPDLTLACLRSLARCTWDRREVIVVDNGSKDDSIARIRAEFPNVRLVENGSNLGFCAGNNRGAAVATGDWILLLNNDTEVDPGFLEPLAEAARDPLVSAMGPKIRYFDAPDRLQYAGGGPIELRTGRSGWRGWGEVDVGAYDEPEDTTAAHGAAFALRREVFERIGGLDEGWFIFYEEIDWSLRIREVGGRIRYVPGSVVYHKESRSLPKATPFRTYQMTRNRAFLVRAHGDPTERASYFFWSNALSLPLNVGRHLRSGRRDLAKAVAQGTWDGWTMPVRGGAIRGPDAR